MEDPYLGEPSGDSCLLSHACDPDQAIAERLRDALASHGIAVEVDPFPVGVDIGAQIETLDIAALVFLCSPESWRSRWCQEELAAARARAIPIVWLLARGPAPQELLDRAYFDLRRADGQDAEAALGELAAAIRERARLYRLVASTGPDAFPNVSQCAARTLADEPEKAVLAEFVESICARLRDGFDPATQATLATALGEAGTREAAAAIDELLLSPVADSHPFIRYSLEKARQRIGWADRSSRSQ